MNGLTLTFATVGRNINDTASVREVCDPSHHLVLCDFFVYDRHSLREGLAVQNWFTLQRKTLLSGLRSIRSKKHLVVTQPFFRIDQSLPDLDVHWADEKFFSASPHG